MTMTMTLVTLIGMFMGIALVAVGGGNSVLPELHRQSVEHHGWLTGTQFLDVFAITRATPGPSMLICTVIGYKAGLPHGVAFAILCSVVATVSFFLPPFVLTHMVSRLYERFLHQKWHAAIQHGFEAVTIGMLFATSYILTRSADHSAVGWMLTGSSALLVAFTKVNPLVILAVGAVLGGFGLVG